MSNVKINPRTTVLILMILIITVWRLLIAFNTNALQFANFSSLGAVALFGGAYFKQRSQSYTVTLLSLLASDLVLYATLYRDYLSNALSAGLYTYLAFAMMVWVARAMLKRVTVANFILAVATTVFIHWVVSDIGAWLGNPAYAQDFSGYINCLAAAVPFERNFLSGTLIYGTLLFGGFELLKHKYPILEKQKLATV